MKESLLRFDLDYRFDELRCLEVLLDRGGISRLKYIACKAVEFDFELKFAISFTLKSKGLNQKNAFRLFLIIQKTFMVCKNIYYLFIYSIYISPYKASYRGRQVVQ